MLRDNLHDAGQIVQHILSQPLVLPGLPKELSLLKAAQKYLEDPTSLEFPKMLETFLHNRAAMDVMLQELKLLAADLS